MPHAAANACRVHVDQHLVDGDLGTVDVAQLKHGCCAVGVLGDRLRRASDSCVAPSTSAVAGAVADGWNPFTISQVAKTSSRVGGCRSVADGLGGFRDGDRQAVQAGTHWH